MILLGRILSSWLAGLGAFEAWPGQDSHVACVGPALGRLLLLACLWSLLSPEMAVPQQLWDGGLDDGQQTGVGHAVVYPKLQTQTSFIELL